MPIETVVAISLIAVPFMLFAAVLAWAEMRTRGISGS